MRPLYGGYSPSLTWSGGFYLRHPERGSWMLVLEIQSHDPTAQIIVNGHLLARPPPTDYIIYRAQVAFPLPPEYLRAGYNELTIRTGRLAPDFQKEGFVWDEVLFQNIRVERSME